MISGSHQPSQSKFAQSKSKGNIRPAPAIKEEVANEYQLHEDKGPAGDTKKPVNLGEKILKVIQVPNLICSNDTTK